MADMNVQIRISAMDRASRTISAVQRSLRGLERSGFSSGRAVSARAAAASPALGGVAGRSIAPLGIPPALMGAGAATYGLKSLITAAADFESQLTSIQKKAGTTAEQTRQLGEEAKSLATSGEIAVPLEEVVSAMERGAAAGLPLGELKEFAKLSAMASDAFEMSAEEVGNAAAGFKTSLKIPMDGMEEYFGLINKLADSGIASERDLINFLDRSGASLTAFGLSAEQAAAYGATLSNIKMAPDVAARMMNSLTTSLLAPGSDKAQAGLEAIVGNIDDFQSMLRQDANGALEFFLDQVARMDKFDAADNLTAFMGKGFSDEVLRTAKAMDEVRRNIEIARDRAGWERGLSATYKLKLDDFWSQWEIVKNTTKELIIDVGTKGLPLARQGLEGLKSVADGVGEGLKVFEQDFDMPGLDAAKESIGELISRIEDLMGMTPGNSSMAQGFSDIANMANQVVSAVDAVTTALIEAHAFASDPAGFIADPERAVQAQKYRNMPFVRQPENYIGPRPPEARSEVTVDRLGGLLDVRKDSFADAILGPLDTFGAWADQRHLEANGGPPALPAQPTGSLNPASAPIPVTISNPEAITPAPGTAESDFTPDALSYKDRLVAAEAAWVGQTAAPSIDTSGIAEAQAMLDGLNGAQATATAILDAAQFMGPAGQALSAAGQLASTWMGTADLNIGPFMAKVARARAAAQSLNNLSVGGGTSGYGAARRGQFAPITHGTGTSG